MKSEKLTLAPTRSPHSSVVDVARAGSQITITRHIRPKTIYFENSLGGDVIWRESNVGSEISLQE